MYRWMWAGCTVKSETGPRCALDSTPPLVVNARLNRWDKRQTVHRRVVLWWCQNLGFKTESAKPQTPFASAKLTIWSKGGVWVKSNYTTSNWPLLTTTSMVALSKEWAYSHLVADEKRFMTDRRTDDGQTASLLLRLPQITHHACWEPHTKKVWFQNPERSAPPQTTA